MGNAENGTIAVVDCVISFIPVCSQLLAGVCDWDMLYTGKLPGSVWLAYLTEPGLPGHWVVHVHLQRCGVPHGVIQGVLVYC